jgi:hypothetical protein
VKTVYDLYHWDHPDAAANVTYGFETADAAAQAAGVGRRTAETVWERLPHDNGWLIDPDPVTGRQTEWGIFERQQAETDAERIELALDLLAGDGQVDGDHHKAWVIDQTVRILAGDRYRVVERADDTVIAYGRLT